MTYRKSKIGPKDMTGKVMMKPATFDGTVAWMDYKAHFDACSELNGWTDEQKGLYLSVFLRGQAQGVFGNLGSGKPSYKDLVTALEERFAPPNQTDLYRVQLRECRQKASESMAELGQEIRRLTNLAYPKAPSDVRETLAKEQFVDALVNSEMRLKIKQARPVDLNDAVRHAVELEAFYRAESKQLGLGVIQSATNCSQSNSPDWKEAFTTLQTSVDTMTKVARTLVKAGEQVPVRCANFSNEPKILYPGTNIANFSPAQVVREAETQKPIPSQNLPKHLTELYERSSAGMSSAQKKQIANLLRKYDNTFSSADSDLGRTGIIKQRIPTGDASPIKQPMRRVPVHMQEEVNKQLDTILENNIIQPSKSPWASGIVLVKKKDGTKRFCIDCRRLNDVTMKDPYPLPRKDESLDQLSGSKWFSCLDLSAGYWQVEVDPEYRQKTAFSTRRGLFEYNVMPFGLCNAPATFERVMETVLSGLHWQICLIYLDDIIIFGKTFGDMINNLEMVLQRFEMAELKLRPQKCQLFQKEVEFLGHIINESGVNTDPKKIECIADWPIPRNVREVRSFLGLCGYYRRFIANYSHIAKPLTRLTEKDYKFNWTEECSEAFNSLK